MKERGNSLLKLLDRNLGVPILRICGKRSRKIIGRPENFQKVGVLCLGAIGDLLLASGLLNGIAACLPDARIEIIASASNAGSLELLDNSFIKTALPVSAPIALLRHIRRNRYDLFIDTTQWARLGAILSRFSNATTTVGFDSQGQSRANGYDITVAHRSDVHESENFATLGKAIFENFSFFPKLSLPDNFINPFASHKTAAFHLWPATGPGRHLKTWPEQYWAELAKILLARGYRIILTGAEENIEETDNFIKRFFPAEKNVFSIAGQYSLAQLGCILKNVQALVSVNTGIMHLGAILGTPTVALHGATNPARWGPIGPRAVSLLPTRGERAYLNLGFEYPHHAWPAMQWITVQDALASLDALLQKNRNG